MRPQKRRAEKTLVTQAALLEAAARARVRRDWEVRLQAAKAWASAFDKTAAELTKEISLQGTFLHRVFCDVLGYLDQGGAQSGQWTLDAEPTTDVNSKRPDGSIGFFRPDHRVVRAAIELKDSLTDLDAKQLSRTDRLSPVEQCFLSLARFEDARYAIVSNFKVLRLYSREYGMTRFQAFQLDKLHDSEEVARFVGVCAAESLLGSRPDDVPPIDHLVSKQPLRAQQEITQEFYEIYADFRDQLVHSVAEAHPTLRSEAVPLTQKLLDRLLFILYAEDIGLLPAGITLATINHGLKSRSRSLGKVWTEFRYLFTDIDKGRSDFSPAINRYNGGLFAHDAVLDSQLDISDDLLIGPLQRLAAYDFQSEIDVNILGHVFENSIADLEVLKRQLSLDGASVGRVLAAADQQRRDLGVYYTPSWVTNFIVDQTLGRYLQSDLPQRGLDLAILDPACGSGAFLSASLTYLATYTQTLKASALLERQPLFTPQAQASTADHLRQLYGLDLQPEAVEISRLSLWLKSASPIHPLGEVDNIVVSNALLTPGEKGGYSETPIGARVEAGGFEVVVANPPWGSKLDGFRLSPRFTLAQGQFDSYELFLELCLAEFAVSGGFVGFIVPDRILRPEGERVRRWLFTHFRVLTVVRVGEGVFPGVFRAAIIIIIQNCPPPVEGGYIGLIITKEDREALDLTGSAQLATLLEERGGVIRYQRVTEDPAYQLPLFAEEDLAIGDVMDARRVPWLGPNGIFGIYGRGEELGRDSFMVQCPGCFGWSINPRQRAQRRGGGYETKKCPHCDHEFTVEDALQTEQLVRPLLGEEAANTAPLYSGEEVNRYWLAAPLGLRLNVSAFQYKTDSLYQPPKILIRQTGVGIYAALDSSNARASQSVYVYRLAATEKCAPEFYLAQLNSRAMVFRLFILTSQVEWQSFPKLNHATLQQLPLRRADLGQPEERRVHARIVELVRRRMELAADEQDLAISVAALEIDEAIESLVMDFYGLTPEQRARIHKRLRPLQNIRIIRGAYPPRPVPLG